MTIFGKSYAALVSDTCFPKIEATFSRKGVLIF